MDDFEHVKISVEEIITDAVEIPTKIELEMECEDVAELLEYQDKILTDKELLLKKNKRKDSLRLDVVVNTVGRSEVFRTFH